QAAGRGSQHGEFAASGGSADGSRRTDSQGGDLRTESRRRPHPGGGRSLDRSSAGAGRRHEPGGGGGVGGTAQGLGVPATGLDRAAGNQGARGTEGRSAITHRRQTDRAVAGGQPGRGPGSDPARGSEQHGIRRRGGSLVGLCGTTSTGISPALSP